MEETELAQWIGAMHGGTFMAYVEQVLAPTLTPGDIVFMDNLSVHKSSAFNLFKQLNHNAL